MQAAATVSSMAPGLRAAAQAARNGRAWRERRAGRGSRLAEQLIRRECAAKPRRPPASRPPWQARSCRGCGPGSRASKRIRLVQACKYRGNGDPALCSPQVFADTPASPPGMVPALAQQRPCRAIHACPSMRCQAPCRRHSPSTLPPPLPPPAAIDRACSAKPAVQSCSKEAMAVAAGCSRTPILSSRPRCPASSSSSAAAAAAVVARTERAADTNHRAYSQQGRQQGRGADGQGVGRQAAQVGRVAGGMCCWHSHPRSLVPAPAWVCTKRMLPSHSMPRH